MSAIVLTALLAAAPVLESLSTLDRALVKAEARVLALETERAVLERQLANLETEAATNQVRADQALTELTKRLRALLRQPTLARARLLGSASSLLELMRDRRVMTQVAIHDRALHARYRQEQATQLKLAAQKDEQRRALDVLAEEQRTLRDDLAARRQERVAIIKAALEEPQALLRERDAAERALADNIKKLAPKGPLQKSFAKNKGRLPWPTIGTLRAGFGQQVELGHGTLTQHHGWDIEAKAGEVVQAVAHGKVVFVDMVSGFGQIVIVDHGDDFHTVSAHLGSVKVEVGAEVQAGSPLGTVGDTGSLRGTLLYFEIRQRGEAQDPAAYLRR